MPSFVEIGQFGLQNTYILHPILTFCHLYYHPNLDFEVHTYINITSQIIHTTNIAWIALSMSKLSVCGI
jgi:hypothetical protein